MKTIILAILLLIPNSAWAWNTVIMGGGVVTGVDPPVYEGSVSAYADNVTITGVTSGSLLVSCAGGGSTLGATTISDDNSNSWVSLTNYGSAIVWGRCYYAMNVNSGDTTVTLGGTLPNQPGLVVHEYSGAATTGAFDQENGAYIALSNTFDSGNITTTVANTIIVGFVEDATSVAAFTWDAGWTERHEELGHVHSSADRIETSTGTYAATGSRASGTSNMTAIVVSFKGTGQ